MFCIHHDIMKPSLYVEWNAKFLGPGGPARHLRHVRIELSTFRGWRRYPDAEDYKPVESVLRDLAQNAVHLERLDINVHDLHILDSLMENSFSEDIGELLGLRLAAPEYSWADPDPTAQLPAFQSGDGQVTEEQLSSMAKFLAPASDALQLRILGMMEESYARNGPYDTRSLFWLVVQRLQEAEAHKLFWRETMMDILKAFSPSPRVVGLVGRIDRKWMAAVANLVDVTVRAKTSDDGTDWIAVEPVGR
jgi:hypothetical protein